MTIELICGDALKTLRSMLSESVDSCVTDPPYHLQSIHKRFAKVGRDDKTWSKSGPHQRTAAGFMNQQWDGGDVAFRPDVWREVLRVLKPGAYLLAFGGTRTYHRLACAIEDAGFEIRDQIGWVYGSGFPKSHNQKGEWEGWGTALKPAWEPIVMARKPFAGTVAKNLDIWGTGAINIDECRVEGEPWKAHDATGLAKVKFFTNGETPVIREEPHTLGRWPANIIHDGSDEVLAGFPETSSGGGDKRGGCKFFMGGDNRSEPTGHKPDSGSAARFFYCAKTSTADRNAGCDDLPDKEWRDAGAAVPERANRPFNPSKNNHPTVKPTALMRYLCRLVTPPGGLVLDPFAGSGSTGRGAALEGFSSILIEMKWEYCEIALRRLGLPLPPIVELYNQLTVD